jgi:adenylate cyclase
VELLTLQALATASGTTTERVLQFRELGLVRGNAGAYVPSDIAKVQLVLALERAGVSLQELGEAVRAGRVSLDFVELLMPTPIRLLSMTRGEAGQELQIDDEMAERVRLLLGVTTADPNEQIRRDDAELYRLISRVAALGADHEVMIRVFRVLVESARRIVDVQREFVDEVLLMPAIEAGMSEPEVLRTTSAQRLEYRALGRQVLDVVLDRVIDEAVFESVVVLMERALAREGILAHEPGGPGAIAFLDISDYTRVAEDAGDEEAARRASRLGEFVLEFASGRHGRLVKLLGDGAMLHFQEPSSAVVFALDAVAAGGTHGLGPLHAGIHTGPMVRRDGDYFGTVVNVASRVAAEAVAGEVLVTPEVVAGWKGNGEVRFDALGTVALKNVGRPMDLYRARREEVEEHG